MGIGLAIVVRADTADAITSLAAKHQIESWVIGEVVAGERGVELSGC